MYLNTFSTTTNFFATMYGDETAELVITKEKTKKGETASRTSFIFSILLTELVCGIGWPCTAPTYGAWWSLWSNKRLILDVNMPQTLQARIWPLTVAEKRPNLPTINKSRHWWRIFQRCQLVAAILILKD